MFANDFYVATSSGTNGSTSKNILNKIIEDLNLVSAEYVSLADAMQYAKNLVGAQHMPSYFERYIGNNLSTLTGLNVKYNKCGFCGEESIIYTRDDRGVDNASSLCGSKCRRYKRIMGKCSKKFLSYIPKGYRETPMTTFVYAMQRRVKYLKKARVQHHTNN